MIVDAAADASKLARVSRPVDCNPSMNFLNAETLWRRKKQENSFRRLGARSGIGYQRDRVTAEDGGEISLSGCGRCHH
jgi:hypothetical protein